MKLLMIFYSPVEDCQLSLTKMVKCQASIDAGFPKGRLILRYMETITRFGLFEPKSLIDVKKAEQIHCPILLKKHLIPVVDFNNKEKP